MRVSRRWLESYVDIELPDRELAHALTMAGLEVEAVESQSEGLDGIVVGEVRSVEPHPNARKLTVCRVFDGTGEVQVVCGAPNVAAGQKVAFAPEGSSVPRNQHDPEGGPLLIGRVQLRGVESAGMICSGYELGISGDRDGILVLDSSARPGIPLSRHLGREDSVFEIGVTANRPDLLSHVGVAREIAAFTGRPLKLPRIVLREGKRSAARAVSVRILDPANCPRYTARVVEGIRVGPSPPWIQEALSAVGIRPINNVVDVTNYVLMEIGQPLHAFDYGKISGSTIVVQGSAEGSSFTTLDGKGRSLPAGTLMICDGAGPVAIAGVMGGANSEISPGTTAVIIESAHFHPAGIRRASKRLGLSTEASQRFERGADPNITAWAADRAAALLVEVAGGTVLRGRVDVYPRRIRGPVVGFDARNCERLLGISIGRQRISSLFRRIGIKRLKGGKQGIDCYSIPTWRPDVSREVDLVEEAARLHGYDAIATSPVMRLPLTDRNEPRDLSDTLRDYLSSSGFREIVTNSMTDLETAGVASGQPVVIANPLSNEMSALRSSLLPGVLATIKHNLNNGVQSARFFEIGHVFERRAGGDPETLEGYREEERLCFAAFGLESPLHWDEKPKNVTLFTLKGEANALFRKISLDNARYIPYPDPTALSERSIFIELHGEKVGTLGLASSRLLRKFDIEADVVFVDLSLEAIRTARRSGPTYRPYPRFPIVRRDIAVIVDERITIGEIEEVIRSAAGPLLRGIVLFDIYTGDQAGRGKKSCAFSLEFVPDEKTLEQQEIQRLTGQVVARLQSSLGAVLRQ